MEDLWVWKAFTDSFGKFEASMQVEASDPSGIVRKGPQCAQPSPGFKGEPGSSTLSRELGFSEFREGGLCFRRSGSGPALPQNCLVPQDAGQELQRLYSRWV